MKDYRKTFLIILSLIVISILTIFLIHREQDISYQLYNKQENCFYNVYDMKTKLVLIKKCNESKEIDSIIFYKNNGEYFQKLFNLGKRSEEQKLILSVKKEMLYYYGPNSSFYCNIEQVDKNKFKTTLGNNDSIDSKYRFSLYYNIDYKIFRIEYVLNNEVENYFDSVSDH
ncbi:hypothetical protein LNQ49_00915 [Flavobacterium sp. F-65]|jgi:hypothetical protein|uniref:Uncharacterized protein n=1 Tax=Flavobacterium pisciphilum TaxID=2893755 RepID=A0ABS8MN28_9FLAO|nr:hypothetical protein [Flavobacterium sp. F-65]MCC9070167.1 hypothetical protein [Flavobacterium sp. F-65]